MSSAGKADPIIGLSQNRIVLTSLGDDVAVVVFGVDLALKGSALATNLLSDQALMAQPAGNMQPGSAMIGASAHSTDSSLREQALGHIFLGQLLIFMWRNGTRDIEVLRSEVDRGGYDVVLEANGVIRHLQLKSSFRGSKVREISVSTKLLRKPGGCVLWLEIDPETLAIEQFYWFGGKAGARLPDLGVRVARHSRGNSYGKKNERSIHRVLMKGRFEPLATISEVAQKLFG